MNFNSKEIQRFVSGFHDDSTRHHEVRNLSPKISIVVPSFNQGRFLERTILSILNQNYPAIELIIIDGRSTDQTLSIIQKYEKNIFYWISEPDNGQSEALNKGFLKATGDIYGWQNSDDIYLPGAFNKVSKVFTNNTNIEVCYGNWYTINEKDHIINKHYALNHRIPHYPYENLDAFNQTIFWKHSAHKRLGNFDPNLYQLMDNDFIIKLLLNEGPSKFYKTDAFLGAFRNHEEQKTDNSRSTQKYFDEEEYLVRKYNFKPADSIIGKYYRLRYRLAQLFESLKDGGVSYMLKRFVVEYKRRGRFI
ncbi:MAG: glycosyltransferase [Desulfobacteraceae bacterium]|nr:glycosyltransferase [Desulfobacteraceae bacterium]MBC2756768.1 glycosyltransferase [Desulfobacteraceae bacterium]